MLARIWAWLGASCLKRVLIKKRQCNSTSSGTRISEDLGQSKHLKPGLDKCHLQRPFIDDQNKAQTSALLAPAETCVATGPLRGCLQDKLHCSGLTVCRETREKHGLPWREAFVNMGTSECRFTPADHKSSISERSAMGRKGVCKT